MDLAFQIHDARVEPGQVAMFWLGQAGFLLKDSRGRQFVIDPYLSDCGERLRGFKRIAPKLLAPEELRPDVYFVTHHHFDHCDYDAIPVVAEKSRALFCAPRGCLEPLRAAGVAEDRIRILEPGSVLTHMGIQVTATRADHGDLAPDALGGLVQMEGRRFYFSGDTAYHRSYVPEIARLKPEVAAMSINGAFGNMTGAEGAAFAAEIGAGLAIPCHFWTFFEHQGAPWTFMEHLKASPTCRPLSLSQGEMLVVGPDGVVASRSLPAGGNTPMERVS